MCFHCIFNSSDSFVTKTYCAKQPTLVLARVRGRDRQQLADTTLEGCADMLVYIMRLLQIGVRMFINKNIFVKRQSSIDHHVTRTCFSIFIGKEHQDHCALSQPCEVHNLFHLLPNKLNGFPSRSGRTTHTVLSRGSQFYFDMMVVISIPYHFSHN